ncbi:hypothetical protein EXE55_06995 [Burkholderia glumae]|uniref:hypothetical protein n=1 Tax=Burkholderia glumae TaxID=337 RepID=UPI0013740EFA|nr:hypothetical protein [Burkholderia glumae]QHP90696.1 hypothetical protein EXE55_06995 [Burkholderia glumae]CAJ6185054.1 Uncharacterised protein [Burkholderia pseudomallei]
MATDSKKPGKTSGWTAVGDSIDGIKGLRPDVLKQTRENIKAIDAHIKKHGVPTASSGTSSSTPVASNTVKTTAKGK